MERGSPDDVIRGRSGRGWRGGSDDGGDGELGGERKADGLGGEAERGRR